MSIQSQVNQTFAMAAGAVALAHNTKVKEAMAAQKELEKEKKLQMRQSEAAQKLAAARQKEQDRLKNTQRTELTKRIQKYFAAKIRKNRNQKGILSINEYYYKQLYKFDYNKLKFTAATLDFTNKKEQIFKSALFVLCHKH